MPIPTPHHPHPCVPESPRGVIVDREREPGYVHVIVMSACGHEAEHARIEQQWYDMHQDEGRSIKQELQVSLAKRCAPWADEPRCSKCPYVPELKVIR